ncbi:flagellar hook-length control protein FliK [Oxobacter pfennigii]|uniref:Flagellar hook-length control protein FliK n=1 Tax=Oxobacter pfennigii TaxID=36849 RepID=A0A0P8W7Q6_9CLOT|nr:flagellar hook-length control protein FliK [Oxobacter pfennigii]KPU44692.1 flagellar hook-length control protein FliK [Oxobacter pfennigii]
MRIIVGQINNLINTALVKEGKKLQGQTSGFGGFDALLMILMGKSMNPGESLLGLGDILTGEGNSPLTANAGDMSALMEDLGDIESTNGPDMPVLFKKNLSGLMEDININSPQLALLNALSKSFVENDGTLAEVGQVTDKVTTQEGQLLNLLQVNEETASEGITEALVDINTQKNVGLTADTNFVIQNEESPGSAVEVIKSAQVKDESKQKVTADANSETKEEAFAGNRKTSEIAESIVFRNTRYAGSEVNALNTEDIGSKAESNTLNGNGQKVTSKEQDITEQFIVQRPEIIRILKGTETLKEAKATAVADEALFKANNEVSLEVSALDKKEASFEMDHEGSESRELTGKFDVFMNAELSKPPTEIKAAGNSENISTYVEANKEDILSQVYDKMKFIKTGDATELHISLKPEELGEVAIKLVAEKGVITGKILVENNQVKSLIESNMPQLKENLKEHNVNIAALNVSVELNQGNLDFNQRFTQNSQNFSKKSVKRIEAISGTEEAAAIQQRLHTGELDLLA